MVTCLSPLCIHPHLLLKGRVIPKTIIKMVQTVTLHGTQCVRVGVWQCSPTV